MSFSISPSTNFANIDWSTYENRAEIDLERECTEKQWFDDVPCCISGYTIEHILESAQEKGLEDTPEAKFLNEYPCVNGVEINYFYEKLTGLKAPEKAEVESFYDRLMGSTAPQKPEEESCLSRIWASIKELFF